MKQGWSDPTLEADVSRELDGPEPIEGSMGIMRSVRNQLWLEQTVGLAPKRTHRADYQFPDTTLCGHFIVDAEGIGDCVLTSDDWTGVDCDPCRELMRCPGCGEPYGMPEAGRLYHRRCAEIG